MPSADVSRDRRGVPGWPMRAALALSSGIVWLARLGTGFGGRVSPTARRILVYRTGRLGDFIAVLPTLELVRRTWPDAHVTLLTTTSSQAVQRAAATHASAGGRGDEFPWLALVPRGLVDRTVTFDLSDVGDAVMAIRRALPPARYDAVILASFTGEGAPNKLRKLGFLRAAGIRGPMLGWEVRSDLRLGRARLHANGAWIHQVRAAADGVIGWQARRGHEVDDGALVLRVEGAAADRIPADVARWLDEGPVIALFPGGTFAHKRWPASRFVTLARHVSRERPGVRFLLVGSDFDAPQSAVLRAALGDDALDATGRLGLPELAAVLSRCTAFVGNDSGPCHIASAAGCPTVAIFSGIEFPGVWEPWNDRHRAVRHRTPCEGCGGATACPLGHARCVTELDVAVVLRAVRRALDDAQKPANDART